MIGAGYVGLVQAVGLASLGHQVVVGEADADRVRKLSSGHVPFEEPGVSDLLERGLRDGCLRFTTDNREAVSGAEVVFIALPTPEADDGRADLSIVDAVVAEIGSSLEPEVVLVFKSTVPVGTTDRVQQEFDAVGATVRVASNPEFLAEGTALDDFLNPSRIVIGARSMATVEMLTSVYEGIEAPHVVTDPVSAEMVKYSSNAYLATRVTFANAIANLCEAVGADVEDVLLGMGHDGRIGHHFMRPGPGFGGSCFPKDTKALTMIARAAGYPFSLLEGVIEVNQAQHRVVVDKVRSAVGGVLQGKRVAVLGLTYKAGTADLRGSPSLEVIRLLQEEGADVAAFDPAVAEAVPGITTVFTALDAVRDADVMVITTDWDEFRHLDMRAVRAAMSGTAVVDGRNLLEPATVRAAGLHYQGIGR